MHCTHVTLHLGYCLRKYFGVLWWTEDWILGPSIRAIILIFKITYNTISVPYFEMSQNLACRITEDPPLAFVALVNSLCRPATLNRISAVNEFTCGSFNVHINT
jgi:hypothetical protein